MTLPVLSLFALLEACSISPVPRAHHMHVCITHCGGSFSYLKSLKSRCLPLPHTSLYSNRTSAQRPSLTILSKQQSPQCHYNPESLNFSAVYVLSCRILCCLVERGCPMCCRLHGILRLYSLDTRCLFSAFRYGNQECLQPELGVGVHDCNPSLYKTEAER